MFLVNMFYCWMNRVTRGDASRAKTFNLMQKTLEAEDVCLVWYYFSVSSPIFLVNTYVRSNDVYLSLSVIGKVTLYVQYG